MLQTVVMDGAAEEEQEPLSQETVQQSPFSLLWRSGVGGDFTVILVILSRTRSRPRRCRRRRRRERRDDTD